MMDNSIYGTDLCDDAMQERIWIQHYIGSSDVVNHPRVFANEIPIAFQYWNVVDIGHNRMNDCPRLREKLNAEPNILGKENWFCTFCMNGSKNVPKLNVLCSILLPDDDFSANSYQYTPDSMACFGLNCSQQEPVVDHQIVDPFVEHPFQFSNQMALVVVRHRPWSWDPN